MTDPDELLEALDQLTNTLSAVGAQLDATDAIAEAVDDWVGEHAAEHHHSEPFAAHAAEHHHSEPFAAHVDGEEPLAAALRQLLAAVPILDQTAHRPGITVASALTEALAEWNARTAAELNRSQPFQPPSIRP